MSPAGFIKINSISFRGNLAAELEASTMAPLHRRGAGRLWVTAPGQSSVPTAAWHWARGWSWEEGMLGLEPHIPSLQPNPQPRAPCRAGRCSFLLGPPISPLCTPGTNGFQGDSEPGDLACGGCDGWRDVLRNPAAAEINSTA